MYLYRVALSTTNRAYFTPLMPALQPYPMSTCIVSPKCFGNGTERVGILVLSMVAISPISRVGSLLMVEMWKLGWKQVWTCLMILSVLR